jgi:hypothetical protein
VISEARSSADTWRAGCSALIEASANDHVGH